MKKFLSLCLVLFLGFGGFAFFACKKDNGYNLKNLATDYENLTTNLTAFKYDNANKKIVIDYSAYVDAQGNNYLTKAFESNPYRYLENYNFIFENSIKFVNNYLGACSNAEKVDKASRNNVKTKMDDLLVAMQKVDLLTENFANQVHFNVSGDITENVYLSTFGYLIDCYNELYTSSYELTIALARIYYNNLLINSNPDVFEIPVANFEVYDILVNLESRVDYELSALSYGYFKTNLDNEKISSQIIAGDLTPDMADYSNYETKIKTIAAPISVDLYKEKLDGNLELKTQFRNYSIELYNLQTCLNNDFNKFNKAKSSLDFSANIENEYYYLLEKNYEALARILSLF